MKKNIIILFILFFSKLSIAQDKYQFTKESGVRSFTFDAGWYKNKDMLYGMSFIYGKMGMYLYFTDGFAMEYENGIDYSSICDRVDIKNDGDKEYKFSFALGMTFSVNHFLKFRKPRVELDAGLAYVDYNKTRSYFYYYIWDNQPYLNDSRYETIIYRNEQYVTYDLGVKIDLINKNPYSLGPYISYNGSKGVNFGFYFGFTYFY